MPLSPLPSPLTNEIADYKERKEEVYEYHHHVEHSPEATHNYLLHSQTHTNTDHTHSPHTLTEMDHPHHSHTHTNKELDRLLQHPPSMSSEFSYGPSDQEGTHGLSMLSDFEAMYQQYSVANIASPHREEDNHSRSDHMMNKVSHVTSGDAHVISKETQSMEEDGNLTRENEYAETKKVKGETEDEDVEEGEVNDSSDETGSGQMEDDQVRPFDLFLRLLLCDNYCYHGVLQATKVTTFYNQLAKPDADKRKEVCVCVCV